MTAGFINFTNGINYASTSYGTENKGINNNIAATNIFSVDSNQGNLDVYECAQKGCTNPEFEQYNSIKMQYIDSILASKAGLASAIPSICPSKTAAMIDKISEKSVSIAEASMNQIASYCFNDIQSILNDDSKTDKEKEKAIQVVLDKMQAASDEAVKKIEILQTLMRGVSKISSIAMNAGTNTDYSEAFSGLQDILSKINTDPSNLFEAETSKEVKELSKENLENILGTNKNENKEKVSDLNNEIKNLQAVLKDDNKTDDEKLSAKIMIASLEAQKEVYSLI